MEHNSIEALSPISNEFGGGASPLPDPDFIFSDDWSYQYFFIVPMGQIKPYNQEVVSRLIHRCLLNELGDFNRDIFPPLVESWMNPLSMCVKITCTKKVFQKISRECREIFVDFGGSPEMFLCYQASGAIQ